MGEQNLEKQEAIQKLITLVEDVKTCMFATIHEDYTIGSRPMHTVDVDDEGNIWFFTNEFSGKVKDVSKDNTVYLMYSHPGKNVYLHVKGTCSVVNDKDKMEQFWSPAVKAWFPGGLEDPALALLKIESGEASYWDSPSSKFVVFYNLVKAVAKGEKASDGEHGMLTISS